MQLKGLGFAEAQDNSALWDTLLRGMGRLRFEVDRPESETGPWCPGWVTAEPGGFSWSDGLDETRSRSIPGPFDLLWLAHLWDYVDDPAGAEAVERGQGTWETYTPGEFLTDRWLRLCRHLAAAEPGTEVWVRVGDRWAPGLGWRPPVTENAVRLELAYELRSPRAVATRTAVWFRRLLDFLQPYRDETGLRSFWLANDWFLRPNLFEPSQEKLRLRFPDREGQAP